MMASRRCPSATPPSASTQTSPASGPRWRTVSIIASLIARNASADVPARQSTMPAIPHIANFPDPAGRNALYLLIQRASRRCRAMAQNDGLAVQDDGLAVQDDGLVWGDILPAARFWHRHGAPPAASALLSSARTYTGRAYTDGRAFRADRLVVSYLGFNRPAARPRRQPRGLPDRRKTDLTLHAL